MELQDQIMDGDLQTLGLQSILKMLALSGKTGTLFVHSGPETLTISLRKGQIMALREGDSKQPDLPGMLCLINKLEPSRAQVNLLTWVLEAQVCWVGAQSCQR